MMLIAELHQYLRDGIAEMRKCVLITWQAPPAGFIYRMAYIITIGLQRPDNPYFPFSRPWLAFGQGVDAAINVLARRLRRA